MACEKYWGVFVDELDLPLNDDQRRELLSGILGGIENEGVGTGRDIWDDNWKAENERNLQIGAQGIVLAEIESICTDMDGSSRIFEVATERQRGALSKLFNIRHWLRQEKLLVR